METHPHPHHGEILKARRPAVVEDENRQQHPLNGTTTSTSSATTTSSSSTTTATSRRASPRNTTAVGCPTKIIKETTTLLFHDKKFDARNNNPTGFVLDCRTFFLSLLAVSTCLRKVAFLHHDDSIQWRHLATWFWMPSLFLSDALAVLVLVVMSRIYEWYHPTAANHNRDQCVGHVKTMGRVVTIFLSLIFCVACTMDISCLWEHGLEVPWEDFASAVFAYDEYIGIISEKTEQGNRSFWMALICIMAWTFSISYGLKRRGARRHHVLEKLSDKDKHSHMPNDDLKQHLSMLTFSTHRTIGKATGSWILCYLFCVQLARPIDPFQRHAGTGLVAIPRDIIAGFIIDSRPRLEAKSALKQADDVKVTYNASRDYEKDDLNVVLYFLESVRSDMLPFDSTNAWAKKFVKGDMADKVSPFFDRFVKFNSTLHVPQVRTGSTFSCGSLLAATCSVHAHPKDYSLSSGNQTIYHECLPRLLGMRGYRQKYFQSASFEFGNQEYLMKKMGYSDMFSSLDYLETYKPSQEFRERHAIVPYLAGLGDNLFIKPLLAWAHNASLDGNTTTTERHRPFLISAATLAAHDPFQTPKSWTMKSFSKVKPVNRYLNCIAYTDDYIQQLVEAFQPFWKNTLFVFVGDHGGSFYHRGKEFTVYQQIHEGPFHVGATFFSENPCIQRELAAARPFVHGNWTSMDLVPTVMELLAKCSKQPPINPANFDGRSMLRPSGSRLRLAYNNPMDTVVFRDGSKVLIFPSLPTKSPQVYDLESDPQQLSPATVRDCGNIKAKNEAGSDLMSWGCDAVRFVAAVKDDVVKAFETGEPCKNCALSDLITLESLGGERSDYRQESANVTCSIEENLSCQECHQVWQEVNGVCKWHRRSGPANPLFSQKEELRCVDTSSWCGVLLEDSVTCGRHVASNCGECTQGHGEGWCNGVCQWSKWCKGGSAILRRDRTLVGKVHVC